MLVGALTLAITAGIVIGVYQLGGGKNDGSAQTAQANANRFSPATEARIAQLMRKLRTKPKDTAALVALGNIFFGVRDFKDAGEWMQRALATDPKNVDARLALGAAQFNLGDSADARREWQRVTSLDPKNVEAYYDLGFLYVSDKQPNTAKAKEMWSKVVELAPNSNVAKTVAMHLKSLEKETTTAASAAGGKG